MKKITVLFLVFCLSSCGKAENYPVSEEIQETVIIPEVELLPEIIEEEIIPEEQIMPEKIYVNHKEEGGQFELPLSGSAGFAGTDLSLLDEINGIALATISKGDSFTILAEEGQWWKISLDNQVGWVNYRNCLVNLPDLLPSIVYDNPYASFCYSCSLGKDIPNVTGEQLYEAHFYNERLDDMVYLTPVLYDTAKKLAEVQASALADGNSLLIFECFRPDTVQNRLISGLAQLMAEDAEVNSALTSYPWSKVWFVSSGISGHQRGQSIDLTLVSVDSLEKIFCGDYVYEKVVSYSDLEMPTQFDELSPLAAVYTSPVVGDQWKTATYRDTMTESALLLQQYCTTAGLVPLASEWWHFDDPTGGGESILGDFLLTETQNFPPLLQEIP